MDPSSPATPRPTTPQFLQACGGVFCHCKDKAVGPSVLHSLNMERKVLEAKWFHYPVLPRPIPELLFKPPPRLPKTQSRWVIGWPCLALPTPPRWGVIRESGLSSLSTTKCQINQFSDSAESLPCSSKPRPSWTPSQRSYQTGSRVFLRIPAGPRTLPSRSSSRHVTA